MKKCTIYLADLSHNYAAKGPFTFPINVGYLASYTEKLYGDNVDVQIFKYPLDLIKAIKTRKPNIVGMSNYTWNLDINNKLIKWIKDFDNDIVTVFGGPDYPVAAEDVPPYLKSRKSLDFYIIHQGETGFANIMERYMSSSSVKDMKRTALENCDFYDAGNDTIVTHTCYKPLRDLEQIPSPYLNGYMDKFFNDNLNPIMETNRGCPYACTFCAWGNAALQKIDQFSIERIKEEIEYIAKRAIYSDMLMLGDANFGIFERDVEIAKAIRYCRDKYGFPKHIFAAWAKGGPKRLTEMTDILGDIFNVTSTFGTFQTLDEDVMKNIKRTNIPLEDFKKLQNYLRSKGISMSSELIIGLPGETKATHLKGLRDMFDYNAQAIAVYNLRMIGGSEMSQTKEREKLGFKTKWRLVDGGFGKYDDILSIESEEMVIETPTMTMDDILYFRPIHFLIQFMWNYKYYEEFLSLLKDKGVNQVDFIQAIVEKKDGAPPRVREMLEDFIRDSYGEWFDSEEDLTNYYSKPENFEMIRNGGFGKLNFKYTYRILLEIKKDFDYYLAELAKDILSREGTLDEASLEEIRDVMDFTRLRYIDYSKGIERIETSKIRSFKHDIIKWKKDGYVSSLNAYRAQTLKIAFSIPHEQKETMTKIFNQYKTSNLNQTLRKMVEYAGGDNELFYKTRYAELSGVKSVF